MDLFMNHDINLAGQVAIVTGGGRGIGKASRCSPSSRGPSARPMAEYALESREGQRWLPWLGEVFKRGEDVPPNHAADLVILLASGRADALSGRFVTIRDDLAALLEKALAEGLGELQTLRLILR